MHRWAFASGAVLDVAPTYRVSRRALEPTRRTYDFERGTIDGHGSIGHDGIESEEYVRINFANTRFVSDVTVRFPTVKRRIPDRHFVFMLRPHLASHDASNPYCGTGVYWLEGKDLVVVATGGDDGAGSNRSYLLFDRGGFRSHYSAWAPMPEYFTAVSLDYLGYDTPHRKARVGIDLSSQ